MASIHRTKIERRMIDFACFCFNQKINPSDAMNLIRLAQISFKAGERYASSGNDKDDKSSNKANKRFMDKAKELGFGVTWPGLWPQIDKDGIAIYLPVLTK